MKAHFVTNSISIRGVFVLLILSFTNCQQPAEKMPTFDIEKARGEIALRLRAYEDAMANGDKGVFATLYAEDAEILHDGGPSTMGRDQIVKVFEGWVRDSVIGEFETTGLWGNADLLVEQGTGYFAHAGGKWKSTGKYLLVWKNVDGEWQIFRDTWFSDPKEEE